MTKITARSLLILTAAVAVSAWAYMYLQFNICHQVDPRGEQGWYCWVMVGDTTVIGVDHNQLHVLWPFIDRRGQPTIYPFAY